MWGKIINEMEIPFVFEVKLLELAYPFGLECFFFSTMVDNSLVLEKQSKPQYNLKTKTDHSTLIARTLPLSKTLRDKIPKATMKITDFVKPP
jgi:hypothetical protein